LAQYQEDVTRVISSLSGQYPCEDRQERADDFRKLATEQGFAEAGKLKPGVKAGAVVAWLKTDYGLGHGHAMAIVALLKGTKGNSAKK
jgi:hypothetical protein